MLLFALAFCGCGSNLNVSNVLKAQKNYFPDGCTITDPAGATYIYDGETYVLSGEAYRELMLN